MKSSSLFLTTLIISLNSFAAGADILIGDISYGGTGCRAGTVSVDQSASRVNLITLDSFKLMAQKGSDRKACSLVIPLDVPKGVQVGIGNIDKIKGSLFLPNSAAKLVVNQEMFFAGSKGKILSYQKKGSAKGNLKIENANLLKDLRWSSCGESVSLRVNLTANLVNTSQKLSQVALSSVNILKTGRLYWRQCK